MSATSVVIIVIYLAVMICIGLYNSRKVKSLGDYVIAGKKIPFWTNVHSISATLMGAGATMGSAGLIYAVGISGVWLPFMSYIAGALSGVFFARKLWHSGAITLPDIMGKRYTKRVHDAYTVVALFSAISVSASQMLAMGLIAQEILQIDLVWAMGIAAMVMIAYTVLGGLFAVATTDVLNMSLLAIGVMIILPFVGLIEAGGMGGIRAAMEPSYFDPFGLGLMVIIGLVVWIMPMIMADMTILSRMFAARNPNEARGALITANLFVGIPWALSILTIGLVGAKLYPGINPDSVMAHMINNLVHPVVGGILLAALLAAVMSTADSILLASASIVANDIFKRINPDMEESKLILVSRVSVIVIGIIAFLLALTAKGIIELMQNISAPSVVFLPVLTATFFWKKITSMGVLWAIVTSVVAAEIWWIIGKPFVHHVVISLIASTIVMIIVSLATYKPECEQESQAEPHGVGDKTAV